MVSLAMIPVHSEAKELSVKAMTGVAFTPTGSLGWEVLQARLAGAGSLQSIIRKHLRIDQEIEWIATRQIN